MKLPPRVMEQVCRLTIHQQWAQTHCRPIVRFA
jgi:hypothetical protein